MLVDSIKSVVPKISGKLSKSPLVSSTITNAASSTAVAPIIELAAPFMSVVVSGYTFADTCVVHFNTGNVRSAITTGITKIIIRCSSTPYKFSVLCLSIARCSAATIYSGGNPVWIQCTIDFSKALVKEMK